MTPSPNRMAFFAIDTNICVLFLKSAGEMQNVLPYSALCKNKRAVPRILSLHGVWEACLHQLHKDQASPFDLPRHPRMSKRIERGRSGARQDRRLGTIRSPISPSSGADQPPLGGKKVEKTK